MFPLQDNIPSRSAPVITWLLILLNAVLFYHELQLPEPLLQYFVSWYGMTPARLAIDPSAWWTLITSMFIHGSWAHIISNMWALYLFGDNVEDQMGPARYLGFYVLCGVAAGLAQFAIDPDGMVPTVGASGAIAGIFGAYILFFPRARVLTLVLIIIFPLFVEIPAVIYLGVWFLSQVFSGYATIGADEQVANIAWWAHIGGFLAGMALMPLLRKPAAVPPPEPHAPTQA